MEIDPCAPWSGANEIVATPAGAPWSAQTAMQITAFLEEEITAGALDPAAGLDLIHRVLQASVPTSVADAPCRGEGELIEWRRDGTIDSPAQPRLTVIE